MAYARLQRLGTFERSFSKGRDVILVTLVSNQLNFADVSGTLKQGLLGYSTSAYSQIIKQLSFTVAHEVDAHASGYLSGEKKGPSASEDHAKFYGGQSYYSESSPAYQDIPNNGSNADITRDQIENNSSKVIQDEKK